MKRVTSLVVASVLSVLAASCSFDFGSLQGGSSDTGVFGMGGTGGQVATTTSDAGVAGAGGGGSGREAGVPDAPGAQPDVPMAGSGGGAGGIGNGSGGAGGIGGSGGGGGGAGGSGNGSGGASGPGGGGGGAGGIGGSGGGTTISAGGTTSSSGGTIVSLGGTTGSTGGTSTNTTISTGTLRGPSCTGLPATCGPSGNESCCTSLLVQGGVFYRSYDGVDFTDKSYPATVSDFYLDKYETTVGRFRAFVNAGMGTQTNPPAPGTGAHPLITGSGWDSAWNASLPKDTASLKAALKCDATNQTWTDGPLSNESQPQNCLDWYTAFAFCAWDGGRLATEAEWNYAASGGNEQRYYPWSSPPTSTTLDDSYAVYCGGSCGGTQNVGSKSPKGDGKWGQSDLAGNVEEWTLDWYTSPYPMPCANCAYLTEASGSYRAIRGSSFNGVFNFASYLRSAYRGYDNPWDIYNFIGVRCARTNNGTGTGNGDAGVPDAPGAQPDVPMGGSGGGTGGAGGIGGGGGASGGTTGSTGGTSIVTTTGALQGPSCTGLPATCGPSGNESCCINLLVPGGTFNRSYDDLDFTDPNYPATVNDFHLDKYEITVGRFRAFVNAGMGTQTSPPGSGAGAHPLIAGSGWDSTWNTNLPKDTASLRQVMDDCGGNWTDRPLSNESQPQNCLDWYTAFAFCAWDEGRLATEAEWNYAASGGNEQRYYPWSSPPTSTTIDDSYAVYCGGSCGGTQNVGSKSPKGDGKWGQSDLAGNVWEWTLDWYTQPYPMPCDNCACLTEASGSCPVVRGGVFDEGASHLRSAFREVSSLCAKGRYFTLGARCARSASQ